MAVEEIFFLLVVSLQVAPELRKAELVALLVLAVAAGELLDRVVGEVDALIIQRRGFSGVLTGARPDVAFFEEEHLQVLSDEHPDPDVELPPVDEQRVLDVLLNDKALHL